MKLPGPFPVKCQYIDSRPGQQMLSITITKIAAACALGLFDCTASPRLPRFHEHRLPILHLIPCIAGWQKQYHAVQCCNVQQLGCTLVRLPRQNRPPQLLLQLWLRLAVPYLPFPGQPDVPTGVVTVTKWVTHAAHAKLAAGTAVVAAAAMAAQQPLLLDTDPPWIACTYGRPRLPSMGTYSWTWSARVRTPPLAASSGLRRTQAMPS